MPHCRARIAPSVSDRRALSGATFSGPGIDRSGRRSRGRINDTRCIDRRFCRPPRACHLRSRSRRFLRSSSRAASCPRSSRWAHQRWLGRSVARVDSGESRRQSTRPRPRLGARFTGTVEIPQAAAAVRGKCLRAKPPAHEPLAPPSVVFRSLTSDEYKRALEVVFRLQAPRIPLVHLSLLGARECRPLAYQVLELLARAFDVSLSELADRHRSLDATRLACARLNR
jgi:hypothetical protein